MSPYKYYSIMRKSKDKKQLRYQMVISVEKRGLKPTARYFKATVKTVRKWWRRWVENGYRGLKELPRRLHNSPNATLFARYLNYHLQKAGADLSKTVRQTDNGSARCFILLSINCPSNSDKMFSSTKRDLLFCFAFTLCENCPPSFFTCLIRN